MYIKAYGKFVNQGVEAIAPEEPTFGPNGTEHAPPTFAQKKNVYTDHTVTKISKNFMGLALKM